MMPTIVNGTQAVADTLFRQGAGRAGDARLLVWIGLAELVVLGLSAVLLYRELKSNHDWNRRRTAHDLIFEGSIGTFRRLRRALARVSDHMYQAGATSATLEPPLTGPEKLILEAILNYFENLALAVKNNVVDEDIAFESMGGVLLAYWKWAAPYVRECRGIDPMFWIQIDPIAAKWGKRKDDLVAKLVAQGKAKL